jgi:peptidoglycan hydrolase-like protein with peptidoglycan-binding domain
LAFVELTMEQERVIGDAPRPTPTTAPVAPAPTHGPGKPKLVGSLKRGSTGALVRYLQGVLGLKQDGQFGPVTDRAVRAFQTKHKLKVDGIVGPITWARLP